MWFEDICDVVAKICFRNGQLSIGTVSSPIISNIVAYKFDELVISYCKSKVTSIPVMRTIFIFQETVISQKAPKIILKIVCVAITLE